MAQSITPPAPTPPPRPSPEFAVRLTPSGQISPTQYKGKVVVLAFILTTCPHCQHSVGILSGYQQEYGPRGLVVMAAAFNDMANMLVPDFNKQFKPHSRSVGRCADDVLVHPRHSARTQMYAPIMAFIDKKGMIRHQHSR